MAWRPCVASAAHFCATTTQTGTTSSCPGANSTLTSVAGSSEAEPGTFGSVGHVSDSGSSGIRAESRWSISELLSLTRICSTTREGCRLLTLRRHPHLPPARPDRLHPAAHQPHRNRHRHLHLRRLRQHHGSHRHRHHPVPLRRPVPGHRNRVLLPPQPLLRPRHRPVPHHRPPRRPNPGPVLLRQRQPPQRHRPARPVLQLEPMVQVRTASLDCLLGGRSGLGRTQPAVA